MSNINNYKKYFTKDYLMGPNSFRLLDELIEKCPKDASFDRTLDLGCGYAKDRYNVYLDGRVLENVDPATFRLKERSAWRPRGREEQGEAAGAQRGYFKTRFNVYYGEKKLDAIASSFVELGGGYAKDSFNVYYRGNKVEGAIASSFKYTGNGYGEDSFDAYYRGKKLK